MLQALIGPVAGLLDKFVEDKDQKNALAHEIATMAERQAHESVMAQIEVNKAEAASASLFKGGWRPAVGWVCAHGAVLPFYSAAGPAVWGGGCRGCNTRAA
jgi:hypothetical protein